MTITDELLVLEAAHMACRAAWLFADDDDARTRASFACSKLGLDYVDMVARLMEQLHYDADKARRTVAEAFRRRADREYAAA